MSNNMPVIDEQNYLQYDDTISILLQHDLIPPREQDSILRILKTCVEPKELDYYDLYWLSKRLLSKVQLDESHITWLMELIKNNAVKTKYQIIG